MDRAIRLQRIGGSRVTRLQQTGAKFADLNCGRRMSPRGSRYSKWHQVQNDGILSVFTVGTYSELLKF